MAIIVTIPTGLLLIGLDNRPISHSHREGLQGAVLWLVDQSFSDSRPCAKLGNTSPNCPPFLKIHFLFMLWNPMALLTALCRCADVYFWGGQIYRSTSFDRISNIFGLYHLVFILYKILKKYLDTQNEFIFNKILIIRI